MKMFITDYRYYVESLTNIYYFRKSNGRFVKSSLRLGFIGDPGASTITEVPIIKPLETLMKLMGYI